MVGLAAVANGAELPATVAELPEQIAAELASVCSYMLDSTDWWQGKQCDDYYFSPSGFMSRVYDNSYQYNIYRQQPYGGWLLVYEKDIIDDERPEMIWEVVVPDIIHGTPHRDVFVYDADGQFRFKAPCVIIQSKKTGTTSEGEMADVIHYSREHITYAVWDNWTVAADSVTFTMRTVADSQAGEAEELASSDVSLNISQLHYQGDYSTLDWIEIFPDDASYQSRKDEIAAHVAAQEEAQKTSEDVSVEDTAVASVESSSVEISAEEGSVEAPAETSVEPVETAPAAVPDVDFVCHMVAITDFVMSEAPQWASYQQSMDEVIENWCSEHEDIILSTQQFTAKEVYDTIIKHHPSAAMDSPL